MMRPRRSAFFIAVVAVGILVAGCSSGGGGNHAAPTTTKAATPTTVVTTTTVSPNRVVANLGSCPKLVPTGPVNAGIAGLATKMVPIDVSSVRLCRYAFGNVRNGEPRQLVGSALLRPPAGAKLADESNRPRTHRFSYLDACPSPVPIVLVTFASVSQRLDVSYQCGVMSNGLLAASPTANWLNELQRYAMAQP